MSEKKEESIWPYLVSTCIAVVLLIALGGPLTLEALTMRTGLAVSGIVMGSTLIKFVASHGNAWLTNTVVNPIINELGGKFDTLEKSFETMRLSIVAVTAATQENPHKYIELYSQVLKSLEQQKK